MTISRRLSVPDISCEHCQMTIEGALANVSGVSRAEVDIAAKTVDVHYEPEAVSFDAIVTAIEDQGYEVDQ